MAVARYRLTTIDARYARRHQPICISTYQHINISAYQHISISTYQHISISAYQHISISAYVHIFISAYMHINISAYYNICIQAYAPISIPTYPYNNIDIYKHIKISLYKVSRFARRAVQSGAFGRLARFARKSRPYICADTSRSPHPYWTGPPYLPRKVLTNFLLYCTVSTTFPNGGVQDAETYRHI